MYLRIGAEQPDAAHARACRWWPPTTACLTRNLGTVSLIGPTRMDYATAIRSVRGAAALLSEFVEQVYE